VDDVDAALVQLLYHCRRRHTVSGVTNRFSASTAQDPVTQYTHRVVLKASSNPVICGLLLARSQLRAR